MRVRPCVHPPRLVVPGRNHRIGSAASGIGFRRDAHHRSGTNGFSKKTAVIIVDHGSRREEANALLHYVVESFRHRSRIAVVEAAHMELKKPDIADALNTCIEKGAEHVVISPFFLSPGKHLRQDIPHLIEKAIETHDLDISYTMADPIGMDPLVIDILERRVVSAIEEGSRNL